MGFLDDLYSEHGQSAQQRVSDELGLTPEQAARALPQVAPVILGGLKRQMEQQGAESVESRIVDLDQNGVPDNLEGLLGGNASQASSLVANQLGISKDVAARLIPMLAPLVIGMLTKHGAAGGGGGGGAGAQGGLGGIASILDRNGDGNIMDDISGMISGGMGGTATGGAAKSGCLGSILAALSGGKK